MTNIDEYINCINCNLVKEKINLLLNKKSSVEIPLISQPYNHIEDNFDIVDCIYSAKDMEKPKSVKIIFNDNLGGKHKGKVKIDNDGENNLTCTFDYNSIYFYDTNPINTYNKTYGANIKPYNDYIKSVIN